MVEKNETTRRLAMAVFHVTTEVATAQLTRAIRTTDPVPPPLRLTQEQYESGNWSVPPEYQPFVLRVIAETVVHCEHELSESQIKLALLRSTQYSSGLIVNGVAVIDERTQTHWVRSSSKRWTHGPRRYRGAKT